MEPVSTNCSQRCFPFSPRFLGLGRVGHGGPLGQETACPHWHKRPWGAKNQPGCQLGVAIARDLGASESSEETEEFGDWACD